MHYQDPRATEARRLRTEENLSSKEIRERLGVDKSRLQYWLNGLAQNEALRPNAKDHLRGEARRLRLDGKTYDEIAETLCVSKSSVSLWTRDVSRVHIPAPGWSERARVLRLEGLMEKRAKRAAERRQHQEQIRQWFEPIDVRYLFAAALISYWCEGSKEKPWGRKSQEVHYVNSDPALIRPFLRFLDFVPIAHGGPTFRIHIHETADEEVARQYWIEQLGIKVEDFRKTVWKRHNPKTIRKNTGQGYYGCLSVRVRRSTALYRYIEDATLALLEGMSVSPLIQDR